jgi:site-specific recombinase XerD
MRVDAGKKLKFQRAIQRSRTLYGKRNLRFVRNNEVLYWRFLGHLEDMGYRPTTVERYYGQLRRFLTWIKHRSVRRLKREDVEQYLLWFKRERTRSPYTLRYLREALAVFFDFLVTHAGLRRNPAVGLRIRTHYPQPERMDLFTQEEMLLMLGRLRELRRRLNRGDFSMDLYYRRVLYTLLQRYLIVKLMFSTGVRPCEIVGAQIVDLDVKNRKLRIVNKGTQRYITEDRNVFLSARTVAELQELLDMSAKARSPLSEGRLFIHYRGGSPLESMDMNRLIKWLAPQCGIGRNVYAYMCRYTYCTRLVENGADPYSLKKLMGHKEMATSLIHYLKLTPKELHREWRQYNPLSSRGLV